MDVSHPSLPPFLVSCREAASVLRQRHQSAGSLVGRLTAVGGGAHGSRDSGGSETSGDAAQDVENQVGKDLHQ